MKDRRKKARFEDDGRVVAPMNVDGMPWYAPSGEFGIRNSEFGIDRDSIDRDTGDGSFIQSSPGYTAEPLVLTRREKMAFTFGVLKAVLLVGLAFIGGLLAFILFCTEIWFR